MTTIGNRIKQCRLKAGLSVDELAKQLNKNRATIYRYENNDIKDLPITILEPLARILHTTPAYLLGWDEEKGAQDSELNKSDEREIESDLEDMMNAVASAAYDNKEEMEDAEAFKATIKAAMIQAKKIAKKKYTPKKYRKG